MTPAEESRGEQLVILGASARAAAQSARRCGFAPFAGDLFADLDLLECCPAVAVADYPQELQAVARRAPAGDWLYTGGLENHPQLVDEIAAERRLLGNGGEVLRRVRDPLLVAELLNKTGLKAPRTASSPAGLPTDGSWLQKPLRSSGGQGISAWCGGRHRAGYYYQYFIAGRSCSAVFIGNRRRAVLLGVTEQLVGADWCGARLFAYCGSLGPLGLRGDVRRQFEQIGNTLACEFGLAGLFGVDAILDGATVWPMEVNPRYTASLEVLERSLGVPAMAWHVSACREGVLPSCSTQQEPFASEPGEAASHFVKHAPDLAGLGRPACGKAIVYAQKTRTIDEGLIAKLLAFRGDLARPRLADIPRLGTTIRHGWPALTVLADGESVESVRSALSERCQHVRDLL